MEEAIKLGFVDGGLRLVGIGLEIARIGGGGGTEGVKEGALGLGAKGWAARRGWRERREEEGRGRGRTRWERGRGAGKRV